jgi:hypothetical protein
MLTKKSLRQKRQSNKQLKVLSAYIWSWSVCVNSWHLLATHLGFQEPAHITENNDDVISVETVAKGNNKSTFHVTILLRIQLMYSSQAYFLKSTSSSFLMLDHKKNLETSKLCGIR